MSRAGIVGKTLLQTGKVIGFRAKIADVAVLGLGFADHHFHFGAGIVVKAVPFHHGRIDPQLSEDVTEGGCGSRGSGTR